MTMKLMPGATAPALSLPLAGGGTYDLAAQSPGAATMVIFYRGLHCPVCEGYLKKVASKAQEFADAGMPIVLVSMDGEDRATKAKADWGLGDLPVAYGLTEDQARGWGLYITTSIKEAETPVFSEPGTFWILPDGTIYLIDIASMPFGRPDLDILLSKVVAIGNGYPARGTRT